jgi:hypothetical protein
MLGHKHEFMAKQTNLLAMKGCGVRSISISISNKNIGPKTIKNIKIPTGPNNLLGTSKNNKNENTKTTTMLPSNNQVLYRKKQKKRGRTVT